MVSYLRPAHRPCLRSREVYIGRSTARYRRRTDIGVSTQQRCLTSCHSLTQRTQTNTQTVPVCSERSRSTAFAHSKRRSELLACLSCATVRNSPRKFSASRVIIIIAALESTIWLDFRCLQTQFTLSWSWSW